MYITSITNLHNKPNYIQIIQSKPIENMHYTTYNLNDIFKKEVPVHT